MTHDGPHPDPRLADLRSAMRESSPRVAIVVGTGVTKGATGAEVADWRGLLHHGINYLTQKSVFTPEYSATQHSKIDAAFTASDIALILQIGSHIESSLDSTDSLSELQLRAGFGQWLLNAFAELTPLPGQMGALEAIKSLYIAGAVIATTNYDNILSRALRAPPVTWRNPRDMLAVVNRKRPGILHLHGHISDPKSIVLGHASYDRLNQTSEAVEVLNGLWLHFHWLFIGCGNTLADPHLGPFLRWGNTTFGKSAQPDYVMALENDFRRADVARTTVAVPWLYRSHDDIPGLLESLLPTDGEPLDLLGPTHRQFIDSSDNFGMLRGMYPLHGYTDYAKDRVPRCPQDEDIRQQLDDTGQACVWAPPSKGKTTLALRLAVGPTARGRPAYYLDVAVPERPDSSRLLARSRILARRDCMVILDNIHMNMELVESVTREWRESRSRGRLLLLATGPDPVGESEARRSARDRARLYPWLPPVTILRPGADEYRRVALAFILAKHPNAPPPAIPDSDAERWKDAFPDMVVFGITVLSRTEDLLGGNLALPAAAAAQFVRSKWIRRCTEAEVSILRAVCLLATNGLDLMLPLHAIAPRDRDGVDPLIRKCLVWRAPSARGPDYHRIGLVEPGWGGLLLEALELDSSVPDALAGLLRGSPSLIAALAVRLGAMPGSDLGKDLWGLMEDRQHLPAFLQGIAQCGIGHAIAALLDAHKHGKHAIAKAIADGLLESARSGLDGPWKTADVSAACALLSHVTTEYGKDMAAAFADAWASSGWLRDAGRRSELGALVGYLRRIRELSSGGQGSKRLSLARLALGLDIADGGSIDLPLRGCNLGDLAGLIEELGPPIPTSPIWADLEDAAHLGNPLTNISHTIGLIETFERSERSAAASALRESLEAGIMADGLAEQAPNEIRRLLEWRPGARSDELARAVPDDYWSRWIASARSARSSQRGHGTWLASVCVRIGKRDLARAIARECIQSGTPSDFSEQRTGLVSVAWLVRHGPSLNACNRNEREEFVERVCDSGWLEGEYCATPAHQIATALYLLALHAPDPMVAKFHHWELKTLIRKAGASLGSPLLTGEQLHGAVQLIGCAGLARVHASLRWDHAIDWQRLSNVAVSTFPFRREYDHMELVPAKFWLGLLALANHTQSSIRVPPELHREALTRWTVTRDSAMKSDGAKACGFHMAMVEWLDDCYRREPGGLAPGREVWTLTDWPFRSPESRPRGRRQR